MADLQQCPCCGACAEPNGTLLSWTRELMEALDEFPTGSDADERTKAQSMGRIVKAKFRIRELIDAADGGSPGTPAEVKKNG